MKHFSTCFKYILLARLSCLHCVGCRQLKASWDSRVAAIAALEAEMGRVRSSFEEREKALEGEKSAAEEHVRWEGHVNTAKQSE